MFVTIIIIIIIIKNMPEKNAICKGKLLPKNIEAPETRKLLGLLVYYVHDWRYQEIEL